MNGPTLVTTLLLVEVRRGGNQRDAQRGVLQLLRRGGCFLPACIELSLKATACFVWLPNSCLVHSCREGAVACAVFWLRTVAYQ